MPTAIFEQIGITELLIVLGIVLVIFGPRRLPMLGRQLGSGLREFKDAVTRKSASAESDDAEQAPPAGLPAGSRAAERADDEVARERR